jgi:hypothetical protein
MSVNFLEPTASLEKSSADYEAPQLQIRSDLP